MRPFNILFLGMQQTLSHLGCKSSRPNREDFGQAGQGMEASGGDVTQGSRNAKGTRLSSLVIHLPCSQGKLRTGPSLQQMQLKVMAKVRPVSSVFWWGRWIEQGLLASGFDLKLSKSSDTIEFNPPSLLWRGKLRLRKVKRCAQSHTATAGVIKLGLEPGLLTPGTLLFPNPTDAMSHHSPFSLGYLSTHTYPPYTLITMILTAELLSAG